MGILSSKATTNLILINDVPNKVIKHFEKYTTVNYSPIDVKDIFENIRHLNECQLRYIHYKHYFKLNDYYVAIKPNIYIFIIVTKDVYLSITVYKNDNIKKYDIMTFDGLKSYVRYSNTFGFDSVIYEYIYDISCNLIDEKIVEKIINDIEDVLTEQYSYETEYVLK
jgi:hypothetical protein